MTRAEKIEEAARVLLAALGDYWLWNGIEHEADGCPEDDTCDCPIVQRYVNADDALRTALAAPKAPERGACACGHLPEAHSLPGGECSCCYDCKREPPREPGRCPRCGGGGYVLDPTVNPVGCPRCAP